MSVTTVRRPSFTLKNEANTGQVGDQGETVISMKLKSGEDFNSDVVTELPAGAQFEVIEVGAQPVRIRISTVGHKTLVGWISKATEQDQPLVKWTRKRRVSKDKGAGLARQASAENDKSTEGSWSQGDTCETVVAMILRESEDFKSKAIGQIPPGAQFEVVEVSTARRVKVVFSDSVLQGGAVGWISSHTDAGQPLCKRIAKSKRRPSLNLAGSTLKIPLGAGGGAAKSSEMPAGVRRTVSPAPEQNVAPKAAYTAPPTEARQSAGQTQEAAPAQKPQAPTPWWMKLLCCSA